MIDYNFHTFVGANTHTVYKKYLEIANSQAWKSDLPMKMSAIIIQRKQIVSVGHNEISPDRRAYHYCSWHAEKKAIENARVDIRGAKILIYRFGRDNGGLRVSAPCIKCQQEIFKAELASAYYINPNLHLVKTKASSLV